MSSTAGTNTTAAAATSNISYNGPYRMFPHILTAIPVKLHGDNYLLWFQSFLVFVGTERKWTPA